MAQGQFFSIPGSEKPPSWTQALPSFVKVAWSTFIKDQPLYGSGKKNVSSWSLLASWESSGGRGGDWWIRCALGPTSSAASGRSLKLSEGIRGVFFQSGLFLLSMKIEAKRQ